MIFNLFKSEAQKKEVNQRYKAFVIQQNFGYVLLDCLDVRLGFRCRLDKMDNQLDLITQMKSQKPRFMSHQDLSLIGGLYYRPFNLIHLFGIKLFPYMGLNQLFLLKKDAQAKAFEFDLGWGFEVKQGFLSILSAESGMKIGTNGFTLSYVGIKIKF